jgi:Uncharacterized conserved protein (DUF2358)
MDILEILKQDYQRFPVNQTYSVYASNVYFKDPLNEFRGVKRYKQMIGFLSSFFKDIKMELHDIQCQQDTIETEWTLYMTPPLPWQPRLAIPGKSELKFNEQQIITSHIDYWHIPRFDVLKQVFKLKVKS